jgi:imidazolonepropionase-like amidohydrolase/Tol biopolymer transport system component
MAWDMQPRVSPDGQSLVFTSDRGGGDNLWQLPLSGGEPEAITEESFRLLSSPAWHPSGDYVVGRKHFTGTRSLGSGEMWMYPLTGGPGLALTDRPNDQLDAGEPAFSPDGRYLYWSQDLTGGDYFQYNKDPNPGIYGIRRLELSTGEIETVTRGAGGAARPTPSADGQRLAFIRRVRDETVLYVRDLASGAERPIWDGLDRDMQETWAIHGTYPTMAWIPGQEALIVWAQGGLWRVTTSGEATPIPFHLAASREIRTAQRATVVVAPESFDVKMIRGARVSPDGQRVVFQALGKLYIADVSGGGTPRRLTRSRGLVEQDPSWTPDGRGIVYVTWDDESLGTVRRTSARGGRDRALTTEPGHYRRPIAGADGVVYFERIRGGGLRSPLYSQDTGIYRIDRDGTERIIDHGYAPQVTDDPDRVYFLQDGEEDSTELVAWSLSEHTGQVIARTAMGEDLRISPDGQHLAFIEEQNAHVMPLPATGRTLSVSPSFSAVAVSQISGDDAYSLHFSAPGTLAYTLGPTLFTVTAEDALGEDFEAPTAGVSLGWAEPLSRPSGVAAIVGATLVTMSGEEVIEDGVIAWRGDRIIAVGPRGSTTIPDGARIIDGAGMTVTPGLIDAHAHGGQASGGIIPEQNWKSLATMAFGVTTVHDPSNNTEAIFAAAELQKAGMLLSPRIFSTGTILYGAKASGIHASVDSLDDALRHLRRRAAVGAVSVKSYNQPRRDQRQQILEAARQVGLNVVPEGGSTLMHNLTMVVDGHTGVEHALPVASIYDDVVQLWSATTVGYTPTLGVAYGGLMGENYWYAKTDVWAHPRLQSFVPREVLDPASRRATIVPDGEYNHIAAAAVAAELAEAGVGVQIGAHGQREGLASHWELWMLVQGGMSPHRALMSGTRDGAVYLGMDADLGTLEVGKLADLMVIQGDPLADIRVSDQVTYTVLGGRVYDASKMEEVWPTPSSRPPLFWQATAFGEDNDAAVGCSCGRGVH